MASPDFLPHLATLCSFCHPFKLDDAVRRQLALQHGKKKKNCCSGQERRDTRKRMGCKESDRNQEERAEEYGLGGENTEKLEKPRAVPPVGRRRLGTPLQCVALSAAQD